MLIAGRLALGHRQRFLRHEYEAGKSAAAGPPTVVAMAVGLECWITGLTALLLGLVAKLIKLRQANVQWRAYRRNLLAENKWRAVRYGINGKLIDLGKQCEAPSRDLVLEMLDLIDDVVDELEIRKEVEYVHRILDEGTSADRQIAVYRQNRDLRRVVDHVVAETQEDIG